MTLLGLLLIIVISACSNLTPANLREGLKPECNKPYILVGYECCLDKDDNAICDKDEGETLVKKATPEPEQSIEAQPKETCTNEMQNHTPAESPTVPAP